MPTVLRRALALAIALLISAGAFGSQATRVAAADLLLGAAELEMAKLLNAERAKRGLIALQIDPRLAAIARLRATDMATHHYFSHSQPDGRDVFDLVEAAGITWFGAGEILAWDNEKTFASAVVRARDGWMGSRPHRAIVLSNNYNYFGIGLAVDSSTGRNYWAGVYLRGPDRTGGWARFGTPPSTAISPSMRYRDVIVTWTGGDVRLVTLTAWFKHFQLRIRTDGGAWVTWSTATTSTSRPLRVWRGHVYELQVRSCDRVGNCGRWAAHRLQG